MAADEPTDEFLLERDLDGGGDLGIDGYWIDDTNGRLVLFQSKYSGGDEPIGRRALAEFKASCDALLNVEYVQQHGNGRLRDVHPDILEALVDDELSLHLIVVTNQRVAAAAYTYAATIGAESWSFDLDDEYHLKDRQLEVLTAEELDELRDRLRTGVSPTPHVEIPVDPKQIHVVEGEYRVADAAVRAKEIIKAYGTHRSGVFRLNVRGPLGSNRVNKEIERTLRDATLRANFHLLNNGLTVVCDSFKHDEDKNLLIIEDFQVVNGCQTTYTLHELRAVVDDTVFVNLRAIESEPWAAQIAKSTNTQSAVKPEDFRAVEEIHEVLREKFLRSGWLYESKRGEALFKTRPEQHADRAKYRDQRVSMREVGHAALAYLGFPADAKWNLKMLFDPLDGDGQRRYEQIFNRGLSPEQLVLPVMIARRVRKAVSEITKAADDEKELDWLPYARTHIVGLIAEWLRLDGDSGPGFLPTTPAKARLATVDDWFAGSFDQAVDAVRFRVEVALEAGGKVQNLREFFRAPSNYQQMVERLYQKSKGKRKRA